MPVGGLSPLNASGLEVTLTEVLAARQSPLGDGDLWSVLFAACRSLDLHLKQGQRSWRHGPALLVTPDTTMLSQTGVVTFARGSADPKKPNTFAPSEVLSASRGQGQSAVEKIYIYSLGMTLYSSADFNLPDGQDMNLSVDLETTLLNMCEDTAELRPCLAAIMQTCREHCSDNFEQSIMAMVSTVLGNMTSSMQSMGMQHPADDLDTLDDASLQAEIDRVLNDNDHSRSTSFTDIPPYSARTLPEGFISPDRGGLFPAPVLPQSPPEEPRRRESGYASASLANSGASNHLHPVVPPQVVSQSSPRHSAAHNNGSSSRSRPVASTSSEEEAGNGTRYPRQVRKDSLDVARVHSSKQGHKKKSPRPVSKTAQQGALSQSPATSSTPQRPVGDWSPDSPLPAVPSALRQAEQTDQPSIVPVSRPGSRVVSPVKPEVPVGARQSELMTDGPTGATASPSHDIASFSTQIAQKAQQQSASRDREKFAARLRSLENNPGGGSSHRVLDSILNFDHHGGDEADTKPVLRHALLNSVIADDNPTSREATGVFVGDTVHMQAADDADTLTSPAPAANRSSLAPTASTGDNAPASTGDNATASAGDNAPATRANHSHDRYGGLATDEDEAAGRTLEHKSSLMMERMYSFQEAKKKAREAQQRSLSPVSSQSESRPTSQSGMDGNGSVTSPDSGGVRISTGREPLTLDLSHQVVSPAAGADDVFEAERGFEPTSPKDYFDRERAESITKLKGFFGPDFCKFDGEERRQPMQKKPYHVTIRRRERVSIVNLALPEHRRVVDVVLLDGKRISIQVEVESIAQEIFDQVVSHQAIKELRYFGLTHKRKGEEVFLDLSCKLKKYAPKEWQNEANPLVFTTFFRVKYFVNNLSLLKHPQTIYLYYLQLRSGLRHGSTCCPEDRALQLAALALQAEIGDLRSDMARQKYFLPEDFLPSMVMHRLSNEELHNRLTHLHTMHKGLSHRQAQAKFVELAKELQEYGILFYEVRSGKYDPRPNMYIGIHLGGILLTKAMRDHERQKVNRFTWQGVDNLLFKKRRFTIIPRQKRNHRVLENVVVWTDHYKMSKYLIELCTSFHRFSMLTRQKNGVVGMDIPPQQSVPTNLSHVTSDHPFAGRASVAGSSGHFSSQASDSLTSPGSRPGSRLNELQSGSHMKRDESISDFSLQGVASIPLEQMEQYSVTLVKKPGSGLGLVVVGGVDTNHPGVFIKKLIPGSAAYRCGDIRRGDRLLAVNGNSFEFLTHDQAISLVRESPPSCFLQMARVTSSLLGSHLFQSDAALKLPMTEEDSDSPVLPMHSTPHPGNMPDGRITSPTVMETSRIDVSPSPASGAHIVQVNTDVTSPGPVDGNKSVTSLLSGISDYGSADLVRFTVHLVKDGGSLGISITGGTDTPTQGGGVYIRSINPNGPTSKDGRLQIGDRIILVNKRSTVNITHNEAFAMLRDAPEAVDIMVERAVLPSADRSGIVLPAPGEKYELTIMKAGQSLGFTIAKDNTISGAPITVRAVLPGEAAAQTGMISPGDYLLSVDNHSLETCTQPEAVTILRATSGQVTLVLQRPELESFITSPQVPLISAKDLDVPAANTGSGQEDVHYEDVEELIQVTIEKGNKRLGLVIFKDPTHVSGLAPIIIRSIVQGQAAAATGQVREGDIIVQANGMSLEGISQPEATSILRSSPATVAMILKRVVSQPVPVVVPPSPPLPRSSDGDFNMHSTNGTATPTLHNTGSNTMEDSVQDGGPPSSPGHTGLAPPYMEPPPIPETSRPVYSDFASDSDADEAGSSLNNSYIARAKWPAGEVIQVTVVKGDKGLGFLVQQEHGNCCFIRRILEGPVLEDGTLKPKDFLVEVNDVSLIDMSKTDVTGVLKKTRSPVIITAVRPQVTMASLDAYSQDSCGKLTPPVARRKPASLAAEATLSDSVRSAPLTPPTERLRRLSPVPTSHSGGNSLEPPLSPLAKPLEASSSSMSLSNDVPLTFVPVPGQDEGADQTTDVFHVSLTKPSSGALGIRLTGGADKDDVPKGVYIRAVVEGTVAYNDGQLRLNDRVLEVNSQPLAGLRHARVVHLLRRACGLIRFKIARLRSGDEQDVAAALTDGTGEDKDKMDAGDPNAIRPMSIESTVSDILNEEQRHSSEEFETTAAESESEFSDFEGNPLMDDEDIPGLGTPEMSVDIRNVLKRLSTGSDSLNFAGQPSYPQSPLVDTDKLLNPASLRLTFSPAVTAPSKDGVRTPPTIPSSPAPPLPSEPPPGDTPEEEGPSLPLSMPPDEEFATRPPATDVSPSLVPVLSPTTGSGLAANVYPTTARSSDQTNRYSGGYAHTGKPVADNDERRHHLFQSATPHDQHHHHHHYHHHEDEDEDDPIDTTPLTAEEKLQALTSGRPTVRRVNKYCTSCSTPPSSPPLSRHTSDSAVSPLSASSMSTQKRVSSPSLHRRSASPSVVRRSTSASKTTLSTGSSSSPLMKRKTPQASASPSLKRKTPQSASPAMQRKTPSNLTPSNQEQADSGRPMKSSEPVLRTIAQELHSPAVSPSSKRKAHERLSQNTFSTAAARAQKMVQEPQLSLSPPSPKVQRPASFAVPPLSLSPIIRRGSSPRGSPLLQRQSMPNSQPLFAGSPLLDRPSSWSQATRLLPRGTIPVHGNAHLYTGNSLEEISSDVIRKMNAGIPGQQFEELRHRPSPFTSNTGKNIRNKSRNRYRNIVAYDETRVALKEHDNDYFNANYVAIDVGPAIQNHYICTQAPLPATLSHFWCMIWQQHVSTVVMTTNLVESGTLKCHQYWPRAMGEIVRVDWPGKQMVVQLVEERRCCEGNWMERKLMVSDVETLESRTVNQLHFLTWPDHGVPKDSASMIKFVCRTREVHTSGRMVVHCSAGVGRTGAFCVVDSVIARVINDEEVDIYAILRQLRQCRPLMVQTKDQLLFCYRAFFDILMSLMPDSE